MTRADAVAAAPQSAFDLTVDLTAAGWRWAIGGHRNPDLNMLRVVGEDPSAPRGIQANWHNGRLHSCVVWDATARETSLKEARALVRGQR